MSLFCEFRPLFQILDDPFFFPSGRNHQHLVDSSFFRQPAICFSEDGDHYVVEAEVPGVKKDNLALTIGKDGKSLTIEGKAEERSPSVSAPAEPQSNETSESKEVSNTSKQNEVARVDKQGSGERFLRNMTFSRTVWLPRPVESESVLAKLDHGVLRVELKKAQDKENVKVTIQ